jgi:hypothetical protein
MKKRLFGVFILGVFLFSILSFVFVSATESCKESDRGIDYLIKGNIFDSNGEYYEDACIGEDTLIEFYCFDDAVKQEKYECGNGCSNGHCIETLYSDFLSIDLEIISVQISDDSLKVQVKRNLGEGDFEGLVFVLKVPGGEEIIKNYLNETFLESESREFVLYPESPTENISEISISPLKIDSLDKEVIGSVASLRILKTREIGEDPFLDLSFKIDSIRRDKDNFDVNLKWDFVGEGYFDGFIAVAEDNLGNNEIFRSSVDFDSFKANENDYVEMGFVMTAMRFDPEMSVFDIQKISISPYVKDSSGQEIQGEKIIIGSVEDVWIEGIDIELDSCPSDSGCFVDGECYIQGKNNGTHYCSDTGEFKEVIKSGEGCKYSYQCSTYDAGKSYLRNVCVENKCVKVGAFKKVINWFRNVFS